MTSLGWLHCIVSVGAVSAFAGCNSESTGHPPPDFAPSGPSNLSIDPGTRLSEASSPQAAESDGCAIDPASELEAWWSDGTTATSAEVFELDINVKSEPELGKLSTSADVVVSGPSRPTFTFSVHGLLPPGGGQLPLPMRNVVSGSMDGDVLSLVVVVYATTPIGRRLAVLEPLSRTVRRIAMDTGIVFLDRDEALAAAGLVPDDTVDSRAWDTPAFVETVSESDRFVPREPIASLAVETEVQP